MKLEIPTKTILLITNGILVCIIVGMIIFCNKDSITLTGVTVRDANNQYKLTNPILDYENSASGNVPAISIKSINEKVDSLKKENNLDHVSLYYRDLNNGQWIGVNEKEEFSPASLLKVPTMIAFLKQIQSNPEWLQKKQAVQIQGTPIKHQNISFSGTLKEGEVYSFLEILESMIAKSDNLAAQLILEHVNDREIKDVFLTVGLPFTDTTSEPIVRVKDYAGFFRVLYNATYLNREMSELALDILTKSEYKSGIVAGVPATMTVAHKFGERAIVTTNNDVVTNRQVQLHDCGIIYYPKTPYMLCVMTRGDDFKAQEKTIQELSKFVYRQISG
jgi:beta-lactamase class A